MKRFMLLLLISLLILSGCSTQAETSNDQKQESDPVLDKFPAEFKTEGYFEKLSISSDGEAIFARHNDISKLIEVKDLWIENNENGVTNDSIVCLKYQSKLQENKITSLDIEIYYLDKNNKRIGSVAVVLNDYLDPNEIEVFRQHFYISSLSPEDIKEEWSGNLEYEFKWAIVLPKE